MEYGEAVVVHTRGDYPAPGRSQLDEVASGTISSRI